MKKDITFEHVFGVCTGKKCKKKGAKEVYKALCRSDRAGKASGRVVFRTKCLDVCKKGPVVMVDNRLWTNFSWEDMDILPGNQ